MDSGTYITDDPPALSSHSSSTAGPSLGGTEQTLTILRPSTGWQLINVKELWRYRELLYFLTWRDVKVRYKQTLLGAAWAILQPVGFMLVFTIFFGGLAKVSTGPTPYPIFSFAGLLPWIFFATAITNAGNSVVGSERLITRIYFPRLAIPFSAVGAALVDFCIAFTVLLLMMFHYHVHFGMHLLLVPVMVVLLSLAAVGTGTLLAALNVAYRDVRYVIPFLVQIWMLATPTVYMRMPTYPSASGFSSTVRFLAMLNPMTGLIATFRAVTLGGTIPWTQAMMSTATVLVLFFAGCFYFRRVEDSFADII